jgi:DNA-directed RNA polymerase subunit omega
MNLKFLEEAKERITNPELLINVVSRRVRQLTQGSRPMVAFEGHLDPVDIALKEIVEGKIGFEFVAEAEAEAAELG